MIPTRIHGVIDYLVGILLIIAPFLLGFADGGPVQWVTMTMGLIAIAYSLATDYEFGSVKLLSVPAHLGIDVVFALVLAASPWLFGFSEVIWWPHVLVGAVGLIVTALTQRRRGAARA